MYSCVPNLLDTAAENEPVWVKICHILFSDAILCKIFSLKNPKISTFLISGFLLICLVETDGERSPDIPKVFYRESSQLMVQEAARMGFKVKQVSLF